MNVITEQDLVAVYRELSDDQKQTLSGAVYLIIRGNQSFAGLVKGALSYDIAKHSAELAQQARKAKP